MFKMNLDRNGSTITKSNRNILREITSVDRRSGRDMIR